MSVLTPAYITDHIHASIDVKRRILDNSELPAKILQVAERCVDAYRNGGKVLLAGNGGSAGDAQHLAAELVGRYRLDRPGLPAIALTTDSSMLTAIANDYGYEEVFARQLQAQANRGDVFIGISTSGNSANVLRALQRGRELGVYCIGLAGAGGAIAGYCDICLDVPSTNTALIQESHIMIGQIICGYIEQTLFAKTRKDPSGA